MSPDELPPDVHPVAALLPWYVNGTLSELERRQVEEHLTSCADCGMELVATQLASSQIRQAAASQATPDTLRAAKAKIGAAAPPPAGVMAAAARSLRTLFTLQWVPAIAIALLFVQSGALLWMTQRQVQNPTSVIGTRGLAAPSTRLTLVFQPSATEQDLRRVLLEVHAHLIAGPTVEGAYIVEVATADAARVDQRLAVLRARTDVVRSAERATR